MDQQVKEQIEKEINNNKICLFMKVTPDAPQCGFSMAVSNILKILNVEFKGKNKVQQHKMVYDALKGKMGNELHAFSITTLEK